MSTFNPGKYTARFNPIKDDVGGGYATGQNTIDQPVKIEALRPDRELWQTWAVMPGEVEGQWHICAWNAERSIYGGVLSVRDPTAVPAGPVITTPPPDAPGFSDKEQYWTLTPVEIEGVSNTYILRPVTKAVGMDYVVGDKDGEMYIEYFDIREVKPKPYWQFIDSE